MRGGTSGSLDRVQTCMYVCLSSQTCMYVCLKIFTKMLRFKNTLEKALLEHSFSFFFNCEGGYFWKPRRELCFLPKQKKPHREKGFEKPFTGRGPLKNPFTGRGLLKNPSQGEGFWKTPHRERGFEKPLTGRGVLKTPHRQRGFEKPLTGRGVLKNPSQGEGF